MREITDRQALNRYLDKYHIPDLFDTKQLPFRLYEYEAGEMLNVLRPTEQFLKFVVDGTIDLYTVREDGTQYLLRRQSGFIFFGDLEFCGKSKGRNYQEAISKVYSVELPLPELLETLKKDNRFLLFLLNSVAEKLTEATPMKAEFSTLEDALLYYIRYKCPDQRISSVDSLTKELNYSRRQIQRVLKRLTETGYLRRTGKGEYIHICHENTNNT